MNNEDQVTQYVMWVLQRIVVFFSFLSEIRTETEKVFLSQFHAIFYKLFMLIRKFSVDHLSGQIVDDLWNLKLEKYINT